MLSNSAYREVTERSVFIYQRNDFLWREALRCIQSCLEHTRRHFVPVSLGRFAHCLTVSSKLVISRVGIEMVSYIH